MARPTASVETLGTQVERAGQRAAAHPVARRLARFGVLCKAAVYPVLSALALIVIWKHRDNIGRLLDGAEPRVGRKGG